MSFAIIVQVYQTKQDTFFQLMEKTVFSGGGWEDANGRHILTMENSGTCGSLRFVADNGENFIVTLGVHNYQPWGDIVTKLDSAQTGVHITPEYYEKQYAGTENQERCDVRWKTLSSYEVTRDGRKYSFNYTVTKGNMLKVNVVIGWSWLQDTQPALLCAFHELSASLCHLHEGVALIYQYMSLP